MKCHRRGRDCHSSCERCRGHDRLLDEQRADALLAYRGSVLLDTHGVGPRLLHGLQGQTWVRSEARGIRVWMALRACVCVVPRVMYVARGIEESMRGVSTMVY